MRRKLAVIGLTLIVTSGFAVAYLLESPGKKQVYHTHAWGVSPPAQYTEAEEIAYMTAAVNGDPFPIGWVKQEDSGEVTGTFTGYVEPYTNELQIVVTIRDDAADLTQAYLVLNGTTVFRASEGTGSILVRNGLAFATMTTLVPANPPYTVEVRWSDGVGPERSETIGQLP